MKATTRRPGARTLPQAPVTMVSELAPETDLAGLRARLGLLGRDADGWFEPLGNVHFARWVVIATEGRPALLAYEANVDGDVTTHVHDLAARLGRLVDAAWAEAKGYPPPGARTVAARERFLTSVLIPHAALHVGHPGIDLVTLRNDVEVRRALGELLDEDDARGGALRALPLRQAHAEVVARMRRRRPDLVLGLIEDGVVRRGEYKAVALLLLIAAGIGSAVLDEHLWVFEWLVGMVVIGLALLAVLALAYVALGRALDLAVAREEVEDPAAAKLAAPERDDDEMKAVLAEEQSRGQNALTHVVPPRTTAFRWVLIRGVFFVVELLARIMFVEGALANITSIHFARWMWIDGGRQLLFFSNYDGTWESYLGEFTDKQATWLSAVWSNTAGFPATKGVFTPSSGAGREDLFKRWTRKHEVLTHFWYAAYPTLGVRTVLDNALIRAALREDAPLSRIREWMGRV